MISLGLDIGSNSVGSAWITRHEGHLATATSVFPAGVEESDDKRGNPKNVKRRMTRHTRVNLARRAQRKRDLRLKLRCVGLLPADEADFEKLLQTTDPWILRQKGLREQLTPHEFGRVLLHLAQRRGALGLKIEDLDDEDPATEDGKVKAAIREIRKRMAERGAATYGEFLAMLRAERITAITTEDKRPPGLRMGPREYRSAIRNKAQSYGHCADRGMLRDEFSKLWDAQKRLGGPVAEKLTDALQKELDDESGDHIWRQKGLLFGQRKTFWDTGTLGRCNLHPTERFVPHADMHASRYLVVEMVNNLKIIERGKEPRPLTPAERERIKTYLSGPLGFEDKGKSKGQPKRSVTVSDLRELVGWGRAAKTAQFRFNLETDDERIINTDWFSREIIDGAVTAEKWGSLSASAREGINRAILKHDPDDATHATKLKALVTGDWAGMSEAQADALVAAWKKRPRPDAKRLSMSRRAVRNLLTVRPGRWCRYAGSMPRRPRIGTGGFVYHVLNRAAGGRKLFHKDADYAAFERILGEAYDRLPIRMLSYCLMPTHWHMVLWPKSDEQLSDLVGWMSLTHAQRCHAHRKSAGTGPLYQGRFKSFPVKDDAYLLVCCRYVERNPLRAKLVTTAQAWPWCSLARRLAGSPTNWLLAPEQWPVPMPADWVEWVNQPQSDKEQQAMKASITRGRPLGDDAWQLRTAKRLDLLPTLRPPGRPPKKPKSK